MAVSVEDEPPEAGVSGGIASAATEASQTTRNRDLDGNPVLAQAGDLIILVHCSCKENDCHRGQRHHTCTDQAAT
jgi:hypothetical protein